MKRFALCIIAGLVQTSYAAPLNQEKLSWDKPASPHTIVREHSSVKEAHSAFAPSKTVPHFPTHVVRLTAALSNSQLTCNDVIAKIEDFYSNQFSPDQFFYNTIMYCSYDPRTDLATGFTINSYFDPVDEEAITYLNNYLSTHDGHDLLGATFKVEKAQAVVVSLNIDAGFTKDEYARTYFLFRHDNANYYYESNMAMRLTLSQDIRKRFFSREPGLILPFIDDWFKMGWTYQPILAKSNYVELRPELVFLMKDEPRIFSPLLRLYYGHRCDRESNTYCL